MSSIQPWKEDLAPFQIYGKKQQLFSLLSNTIAVLNTPRLELGCVRHFFGIVFGKTGLQILR